MRTEIIKELRYAKRSGRILILFASFLFCTAYARYAQSSTSDDFIQSTFRRSCAGYQRTDRYDTA